MRLSGGPDRGHAFWLNTTPAGHKPEFMHPQTLGGPGYRRASSPKKAESKRASHISISWSGDQQRVCHHESDSG